MPLVTGQWRDISLDAVPLDIIPQLEFRLSCPAITPGGALLFRTSKWVTPRESGGFEVELTRTDVLTPVDFDDYPDGVWINIIAHWLADSSDPNSGFDQLLAKIRVPEEGGDIGTLTKIVVGYAEVHTSSTALDMGVHSGFQLNTVTGDLYKRVGSA